MPRAKPKRVRRLIASLPYFLPAAVALAAAALIAHPAALLLLLAANTLALAAVCRGIGFEPEDSFARDVLRRGAAHYALLAVYTAVVMLLIGVPALWLIREGSLAATLAVSTAAVVALLVLWRFWAAFGLLFVWDDAYPDEEDSSWIFAALSRSLAFSRHLTRDHDLYFSHGLAVGFAELVLVVGALALAGLGGVLPNELRIVAFVVYGAALLPLGQLIVANRTLRALLTAHRNRHDTAPPADEDAAADAPA
ncbi:MAG TPA: hypothetical protein VJ724_09645, partial [Tahibacter sp.]|nr:hypothetical protein [Tahibacter sp.]